ncbi:hypothetical protein DQG23_34640 [Paenibacillus contaminans]|uniref:Uncharacterized protein n=1 Tax=Paenibacillus contaminans TaxID=450362 RepID=A0A329M193_9BACL|nr:hypothetical protein DQG23_34640 [Paenibacillus contaminans]
MCGNVCGKMERRDAEGICACWGRVKHKINITVQNIYNYVFLLYNEFVKERRASSLICRGRERILQQSLTGLNTL